MQKPDFTEAVDRIVAEKPGIERDAYYFLRDALDYTVKLRKKARETAVDRHVSGQQLLEGIRQHALREFGPMVVTVFEYWGVRRCEDFGEMVYRLIGADVFGKKETDSIDDFGGGYSFREAFVAPFQPEPSIARRRVVKASRPAENLN